MGQYNETNPEAEAEQSFDLMKRFMFPKMAPHQRAMLVPGTFGCRGFPANHANPAFKRMQCGVSTAKQDEGQTAKIRDYYELAQADSRVVGLCPWHWFDWPSFFNSPQPQFGLGAASFPKLRATLEQIGHEINATRGKDVSRKTDDDKPLAPSPFLPPLLRMDDGQQVLTPGEWPERRAQVASLVQEYLLGTVPPQRPALLSQETLNTTRLPAGALSSFVRLTFGDDGVQNVTFDVEMLRPAPSSDRQPLFLTMFTHRPWALLGLSRGYAAAIFPGCDGQDIAPAFQQAYKGRYTMALIMARALVASLTLDYALGLDYVATSQVCMTGHSRNGKLSLVAAAFDERITAVVGSSPGAPIATPFRFSSAMYFGQDAVTSPPPSVWFSWWVAKSREYIGRENEMPMDGHGVVGMIAPRAAAIATAWQDRESDLTFGNEQNLRESATVYKLLGAPGNLSLLYRSGDHHGYIEPGSYFDFFDRSFGRRQELAGNDAAGVVARDAMITAAGFDWPSWQRLANASRADAPSTSAPLAARIGWLLDHEVSMPTTHGAFSVPDAYCEEASPGEYTTLLMDHDRSQRESSLFSSRYENISHVPFSVGGYVTVSAYYDREAVRARWHGEAGVPAAIWLHPYSYNRGFDTGGNNTDTYLLLAKQGFIVFAFDMAGMGMRYNQGGARFYRQTGGQASLLGKHVEDTSALLQAILCFAPAGRADPHCSRGSRGFTWPTPALDDFPVVDPDRVFVGGFSMGGIVALHAAALDRRLAGVFSIASFTPMRTDTADRPTGGLRRLSHLHALVPKLGLFVGEEHLVPYDYDDVLGAIAPRPTLLITPTRDRDATLSDVTACIRAAQDAWGAHNASGALVHLQPDDYSRLSLEMSDSAVQWALQAATQHKTDDIEVVWRDNGTAYDISIGGSLWMKSAATRIFSGRRWFSTHPAPGEEALSVHGTRVWQGSDSLGTFRATTVELAAGATPLLTTARVYNTATGGAAAAVVFEQSAPAGVNGTNYAWLCGADFENCTSTRGRAAPSPTAPVISFPALDVESGQSERLDWLTWFGTQINSATGRGLSTLPKHVLGLSGGPIAAFEPGGWAAVLSPAADRSVRLSTSHIEKEPGNSSLSFGISSELESLPAGFTTQTVMVVGRGLTETMSGWGAVLETMTDSGQNMRQRKRFAAQDPALTSLGMWTDNGAYYHANSWADDNETRACVDAATGALVPGCFETLFPQWKADLERAGVPVRQLQLDSWYYDGHLGDSHVYCVRNWTAAKKLLFPSGSIERVVRDMDIASTSLYLPFFVKW